MNADEKRPRRPSGTGSVRNRGKKRSPRWFAYHWVIVEGERRQVSQGPFSRRSDAERWLRDELQKSREGRPTLPSRITVAELLDEWLALRRPALEPNTYAEYARVVEHRIKPHLGARRVRDLRPGHVATMLRALREPGANRRGKARRPLTETSLQHTYVTLRSAIEYAVRQRIVSHNVMADVDRPRRQATRISVWSAAELAAFLAASVDDRLGPLFRLASHTGARRSELLGLRWSHVDVAAATISIASRRTRVGYEMVERAGTKTAAGARVVDLDPDTVAALRLWRKAQAAERAAWGEAYTDTGYVFSDQAGQPLHADHVANRFDTLVRSAKVPAIRFHDLRHTHATLLLKAGVPVHVVAQRLGHSSPALTLSIYSHVLPRQQSAAAAAFARLVDQRTCSHCGEALGEDATTCGACEALRDNRGDPH
jgi:integrase